MNTKCPTWAEMNKALKVLDKPRPKPRPKPQVAVTTVAVTVENFVAGAR